MNAADVRRHRRWLAGLMTLALLLTLSGCVTTGSDAAPQGEPESEPATIQFYLASTQPQPDYREMTDEAGGRVYVAPAAALTRMDVAQVRALHSDNRSMLQIVLTRIGSQRAYLLTRDNVGARLAVLVDGELICAPPIHGPVTDGQLHVVGNLSRREAEKLAAAINRRPDQ